MKVWVVMGFTGQYEDVVCWPARVCMSAKSASTVHAELEAEVKRLKLGGDQLPDILYRIGSPHPTLVELRKMDPRAGWDRGIWYEVRGPVEMVE